MKKIFHLNSVILILATLVAIELSVAPASSSDLEDFAKAMKGTWILESTEIIGTVYKPPEASGLMVFTDRYYVVHTATPVSAACETGEYQLVGTKVVGSINSSISVNFPPGTEGTITSTESQPFESEVSMVEDKFSFEPMPGFPWIIEKDKITVGVPNVLLDTWRRVEPGGFDSAETIIAKVSQGVSVLESRVLADGTVQNPSEVTGLLVNTGRYFLLHVVSKTEAVSQIGEYEVIDLDRTFNQKSWVSVNFPPGSGTRIDLEPKTFRHKLSVEDAKVSYTVKELGAVWTLMEDTGTTTIPGMFTLNWKKVEKPEVPKGHFKFEMFYNFVQDYASKPEERPDGLYLVSTQNSLLKARSFTFTFDDGNIVSGTAIFRGQHQELKVITDEKSIPIKGVGTSYGLWEAYDEYGNTIFRGTYTGKDEIPFSPDFKPVGFSVEAEAVGQGEGLYAGYLFVGDVEARLGPDPEKPGEFVIHGVGEGVINKMAPVTGVPVETSDNVFFASFSPGLNMISLPLKPRTSYTARSFAEYLGSTVVIKIDEKRQKFVGFTLADPDDGFTIEGGKGYIVNMEEGKTITFVGAAWTNTMPVEAAPPVISRDSAWAFIVSGSIDEWDEQLCVVTVKNLRTGECVTAYVEKDGYFSAVFADLTRKSVVQIGDDVEVNVKDVKGDVIAGPVQKRITRADIHQAFAKLHLTIGEVIPQKTVLLQNYPNPFNPETWIPFKLSQTSDVTIAIYDIAGELVRVLHPGKKPAGSYISADKAAYWDGINESGEQVSSGVYFYTLKAEDFSATRRMVILK
jgi:hypothetical protein